MQRLQRQEVEVGIADTSQAFPGKDAPAAFVAKRDDVAGNEQASATPGKAQVPVSESDSQRAVIGMPPEIETAPRRTHHAAFGPTNRQRLRSAPPRLRRLGARRATTLHRSPFAAVLPVFPCGAVASSLQLPPLERVDALGPAA